MNKTTDMTQPTQRKKFISAKFLIFIIILLVLVLLSGSRDILASSSYTSVHGNILGEPGLASTSTAKATSTSEPTTTTTPTPSSTPPTTIRISGTSVNLRTGPSIYFSAIRKLTFDEQLLLLGRLSDNTWVYVKTSDGQDGWIGTSWVDLAGINLYHDDYPVTTPSPAPPATIRVSGTRVNLRTGPGTNYLVIQKLNYDEQLLLLGRLKGDTWLYVETTDGEEGWVESSLVDLTGVNLNHEDYPFRMSPPTETATPVVLNDMEGHWIDVDLSEQMLRAYNGTDLEASFLVSTGIDLYPTETGQYHIFVKYRYSTMRGSDYFLPDVPYSMYYSGDFSIHGTYWHHNFGTPMSHGCVNMDTSDAEWLYYWSSIGTLVNIHR
jgi:lipoprotein-anchoring transpeptidase ErfK/SrfK